MGPHALSALRAHSPAAGQTVATPEGGDFRSCCALHSNRMVLDENVMAHGVAMHCGLAESFLRDGFGG